KGYAKLGAGRALLRGGRAREALDRLHEIPTGEPYYEDAESLIAEASFLVGEWDFAIDTLRAHLSRGSAPVDSVLASIRLAEALLDRAASDAHAERRAA